MAGPDDDQDDDDLTVNTDLTFEELLGKVLNVEDDDPDD